MLIKLLKCVAALTLAAAMAAAPFTGTVAGAQAQSAAPVPVMRTVGLLDTDGTALYSVLFESAGDPLGSLTVTSALPADTTLVEAVSAPTGATFLAAADGQSVSWQFASLDANTILGPFTFRVKANDPSVAFPTSTSVLVSWTTPSAGLVIGGASTGYLSPLDTTGQVTFDAKGTVDAQGQPQMLPVGKTGISVYAPVGAVLQTVTLSFTREVITDSFSSGSATLDGQYWWCGGFLVTSSPAVRLLRPIEISEPSRQVLTPGLATQAFHPDQNHVLQPATDVIASSVSPDGNHMLIQFSGALEPTPSASRIGGGRPMMSAAASPLLMIGPEPEPRGVLKAARALGQVKAPDLTPTVHGNNVPVPDQAPEYLEMGAIHTCTFTDTSTVCTVYVNGVSAGTITYPGHEGFWG